MSNAQATALLAKMRKQFGENAVKWATEIVVGPPISSGSLGLDCATGYGGFPDNRVIEIYGRPGTGKTTLALITMANALRKNPDKLALFMDVEHKITKEWLRTIVGDDIMDSDRIVYVEPTSIENATNVYRYALDNGPFCCAILDSIGGAPTVRTNDDAERANYGGNAMGVGAFARSANVYSSTHHCLTIGINQVRANMGMGYADETPGGHQWKHSCVMRIELVKGKDTETIKPAGEEKEYPIGYTIWAKVRKNQVGPPGRTAMYWFFNVPTPEWGFGIDFCDEISRLSIITQTLKVGGGWYHHPVFPAHEKSGEHKVQGLPKVKELIRNHAHIREVLSREVLSSMEEHASEIAPISDPEAPVETEWGAPPISSLSTVGLPIGRVE